MFTDTYSNYFTNIYNIYKTTLLYKSLKHRGCCPCTFVPKVLGFDQVAEKRWFEQLCPTLFMTPECSSATCTSRTLKNEYKNYSKLAAECDDCSAAVTTSVTSCVTSDCHDAHMKLRSSAEKLISHQARGHCCCCCGCCHCCCCCFCRCCCYCSCYCCCSYCWASCRCCFC